MMIYESDKVCSFLDRVKVEKPFEKRNGTFLFNRPVFVKGKMTAVGKKESAGPVGKYFDVVVEDDKLGKDTFENGEIALLTLAVKGAIKDANCNISDIDLYISGDLLNQITTSSYVARTLKLPYLGIYNACSTMSEALGLGAMLICGGYYDNIACSTVSHFATAERQFRFPLEYGCQRPPYAQWTVTGAGCSVLSSSGEGVRITGACFGRVVDYGVKDMSNMGAAMAPGACDTLLRFLSDTNTRPSDYDLILTGDLGKLGSDILRDLCRARGVYLGQNYIDCGSLIYDNTQSCYQGGSGAGCSATVVNAFVIKKMLEGEYKKTLYLATGALMNTQSCYQGESIPAICHAVTLEI